MKKNSANRPLRLLMPAALTLVFVSMLFSACQKQVTNPTDKNNSTVAQLAKQNPQLLKDFTQVNLIANNDEYNAATIDPNIINAWGLSFSSGGVAWISSFGAGLSLVYTTAGVQARPPVAIPSPAASTGGLVTGTVFNATPDFVLSNGSPARFIFDNIDGVISGWNPAANNNSLKAVDRSSTSVYTGLAIGQSGGNNYLYAANFRSGHIDVFDKNFALVSMPFTDPGIPAGYAPFNVQSIGDWLYITYAKVGDGEEEPGPGLGYVSIFGTDGSFVKRFTSKGQLNAPWGIAQASPGFFGDETVTTDTPVILVGNFGDGHINAFDANGNFLGQLRAHGNPIVIEGLWAISFAPVTATSVDPNKLFFTAGPDDETHGLFGYISK